MYIFIGLGNPGEKYKTTRHNLGFRVVDMLLEKYKHIASNPWHEEKRLQSLLKTIQLSNQDVLLVKPQTFMNVSGKAVQRVMQEYKGKPTDLFVVYDDLDLQVGEVRIRFGGGSGGHNGVQSIIDEVGEDFYRIRIGIGRPIDESVVVEDYVLQEFYSEEKVIVEKVIPQVITMCEDLVKHGYEIYMSKYYKK
jgi:peptidyl-tRNA hydrolase, PTH1 family